MSRNVYSRKRVFDQIIVNFNRNKLLKMAKINKLISILGTPNIYI